MDNTIKEIINQYFKSNNIICHQLDSYEDLIHNIIPNIIEQSTDIISSLIPNIEEDDET